MLLFGAAQHLLAKTMSCSSASRSAPARSIALYDGDDVLGLAAANGPVKLGWGVAAAVLLVSVALPRRRREEQVVHAEPRATPRADGGTADPTDVRRAKEERL